MTGEPALTSITTSFPGPWMCCLPDGRIGMIMPRALGRSAPLSNNVPLPAACTTRTVWNTRLSHSVVRPSLAAADAPSPPAMNRASYPDGFDESTESVSMLMELEHWTRPPRLDNKDIE